MAAKKQQNARSGYADKAEIAKRVVEYLAQDGTQSHPLILDPGTTCSATVDFCLRQFCDSKMNERTLGCTEDVVAAGLNESVRRLTVQLTTYFKEHQQEVCKCSEDIFRKLVAEFLPTRGSHNVWLG